jgi:LysM repeat protein
MFFRFLRNFLILAIVIAVFAAVAFFIQEGTRTKNQKIYDERVTYAIETAIANALFVATRTAEASLNQYRLIVLDADDTLAAIAARYSTTVDVLRMANGLALDVEGGVGAQIVVPEGVQLLDPPRRLEIYEAQPGETLDSIAQRLQIELDLLILDNRVLAQRQLNAGDIVFIPTIL